MCTHGMVREQEGGQHGSIVRISEGRLSSDMACSELSESCISFKQDLRLERAQKSALSTLLLPIEDLYSIISITVARHGLPCLP